MYRILALCSDQAGCFQYRIKQPFNALKRHGIRWDTATTLPSAPNGPGVSLDALIRLIGPYDMVVIQRYLVLDYIKLIKNACFLMSKPLVFEVDDDYIHLEQHNPCYYSTNPNSEIILKMQALMAQGKTDEIQALVPALEAQRIQGIAQYKEALSLFDGITVTTEELKQTIYPYNKNIAVLPNQSEQIFLQRDSTIEEPDENGNIKLHNTFGMWTIPGYYYDRDPQGNVVVNPKTQMPNTNRILRIGYTGTSSHVDDFRSIEEYWGRLVAKYAFKCWFVYIGDAYFFEKQIDNRRRRHFIPANNTFDIYKFNVRNLDIGVAPLQPTVFNMAKSDIKAVEYGSWGVCPVLPDYITYNRNWKHGETALLYKNGKEFYEVMENLINKPQVVNKIGNAAQKYVFENRMEDDHTQERFDFYKSIIDAKPKLRQVVAKGA